MAVVAGALGIVGVAYIAKGTVIGLATVAKDCVLGLANFVLDLATLSKIEATTKLAEVQLAQT